MFTFGKIKRYRSHFKNWITVILHVQLKKLPILVKYRDGTTQKIYCYNQLVDVSHGFKFSYWNDKNSIVFNFRGKELKFHNVCDNGSLGDVFVQNELDSLSVGDKDVLDIGANIGDSAIFFALKGAKRVIAVEPFPSTFEALLMNIKENNFQDVITPRNYAVSNEQGSIKLSNRVVNSVGTMAKSQNEGTIIPTFTLRDIVEEFSLSSFILKMDCEGCEYEVLDTISETLSERISEIFVEYHDTPRNIPKILQDMSFEINVYKKSEKMGLIHGKNK